MPAKWILILPPWSTQLSANRILASPCSVRMLNRFDDHQRFRLLGFGPEGDFGLQVFDRQNAVEMFAQLLGGRGSIAASSRSC